MATTQTTRRRAAGTPPVGSVVDRPILSATEVRNHFSDVINRVSYRGERILVGRRGNASRAVAMVPAEDLMILEALEDQIDLSSALAALRANGDEKTISWHELKKKLGV